MMRDHRLRKWLLIGLALIALSTASLLLWSNWPITTDSSRSDPAVALANEIGTGNTTYHEGYVGELGSRIHYVSAGQGDPIIFVHGFPSYWFTMFGLMEEFKSQHRVIAIDGLGVGKSDAPGDVEAYRIESLVKHLDTVIDELNLGRVHLVGHDWGAALTAAYAQAFPEKVKTLTAMSALPHNIILSRLEHDAFHREKFSYVSRFLRANPSLIKLLGVKDQIWESTYQPLLKNGLISEKQASRIRTDVGHPRRLNRFIHWYRANFPEYEDISDDDFWPARNARLTVPATFIYGEADPVVTEPLVNDLRNLSDNLTVLKLKETGHRPHFERKQIVVSAIKKLVTQR